MPITFPHMNTLVKSTSCALIGAPVQSGTRQRGCVMGPDAFRSAGLAEALQSLGHQASDLGNLECEPICEISHPNANIHGLAPTSAWIDAISKATYDAAKSVEMPIILGGDHSVAAGSVPALARHAEDLGQDLFVLWLDAHTDLHLLDTTQSGNLHGTPIAYMTGCDGFEGYFPTLPARVRPENICMMGLRSVDPAERSLLADLEIETFDMRAIDELGVKAPLNAFLNRVRAAGGRLHVSLDVDFLDPGIACAVGTTVPGGATFREAHLIMELLHESGLVTSLDLVELNPFLDERGRTAQLMVDLTASLMGRKVLDKPTRQF